MADLDRTDTEQIMRVAHLAADAARVQTLEFFRGDALETQSKRDDFDPVTVADRAAEKAMREIIRRERPEDSILGEEFGLHEGSSGITWVLDPIDGTRAYISGTPTWGVLIGVRTASDAIYGIVDQPYIGERFSGGFETAEMTGPLGTRVLAVKGAPDLAESTIFTTFPEVGQAPERDAFHTLAGKCKLTRYGMDCYAYALLAAGQIDLVVEAGLQSYDILGPLAVIEAAGGIVTNWQGGSALDGGRVVAAATPALHAAALDILSAAP